MSAHQRDLGSESAQPDNFQILGVCLQSSVSASELRRDIAARYDDVPARAGSQRRFKRQRGQPFGGTIPKTFSFSAVLSRRREDGDAV